jgi:AraC-like DNA-binding protein
LNRKRVAAAKEMLRSEDMNISEAGFAVGYNDLSYFSRVFRSIEGISPSDFRKSL